MILNTITRSLQVTLAANPASNNLPVTVDYVDITASSLTPGLNVANSNGTTAASILGSPAASTQRKVNGINIFNADTVASKIMVTLNDNSTLYPLVNLTLQVGETLGYTDAQGWYAQDVYGNRKTAAVSPANLFVVKLAGANLNSNTDQAIAGFPAKYLIMDVVATNCSGSASTAVGGIYTAGSKGGNQVIYSGQGYSSLTGSTSLLKCDFASGALETIYTSSQLYFSLTTPQGAAMTADIYVYGVSLP